MIVNYDIALITEDPWTFERVRQVCHEFDYCLRAFKTLDEFIAEPRDYRLIIAAGDQWREEKQILEFAQIAKQISPYSFTIATVHHRMPQSLMEFTRKNGCDLILLNDEILETSKLEFILTQTIRAHFLPIKSTDLSAERPLSFDIFHLLPIRGKFLPAAFAGETLSPAKLAKLHGVNELYITRAHAPEFAQYVAATEDLSAAGLAKRCRAHFLALYGSFTELVFELTDQSTHSSYSRGEELLARCRELSGNLLGTLAAHGKAWEIINNSVIGDFGSTERSPAVASYAAILALQLGLDEIEELMVGALMSELGILLMPPHITSKIRQNRVTELNEEEQDQLQNYPKKSIQILLDRKVQLADHFRQLLSTIHQRADGKGFPKAEGPAQKRPPNRSQLLHLAHEIDSRSRVRMGEVRPRPEMELADLIQQEMKRPARFSPEFIRGFQDMLNQPEFQAAPSTLATPTDSLTAEAG